MCQRIAQKRAPELSAQPVRPGEPLFIIRSDDDDWQEPAATMTWGLPMTDRQGNTKLIYNARAETVHQRPTFRSAMNARRLAVPVEYFYEFPKNGAAVTFRRRTGARMLLAGLWQPRQDGDSCVIITQMANSVVRPHHHRMPALLAEQHLGEWLDPATSVTRVLELLRPTEWTTVDAEPETAPEAAAAL